MSSVPLDVELLRRRDPAMTERFLEALRRFVRIYVRVRADMESVARDALADLLEKLDRGDQPDNVVQWIWTAASNATRRHRRRRRRPTIAFVSALHTRGVATLSEIQRARDQLGHVGRGLARMPDAMQHALIETGIEGRTARSVANELGVPAGTLRKDLSRARLQLRRELSDQEKLDRLREIARECRRKRAAEQDHPSPPFSVRRRERSEDSSTASR